MKLHGASWARVATLSAGLVSLLVFACADEDLSSVRAAAKGSAPPGAPIASPTAPPVAVHYVCDGGKTFDAYVFPVPARRAIVVVDGRTLDLPQTVSGSGIRYSDGTLVYHSKGRDAFIEVGGVMTYVNCIGDKP